MFRPRSLRVRIALAYIAGSVLVSGLIGVATYSITSRILIDRAVASAKEQSFAQVEILRREILEERSNLTEILGTMQSRGLDVVLKTTTNVLPPASTSIGVAERTIPIALRRAVEDDRSVSYAVFDGPDHRRVAIGSFVPGVEVGGDPRNQVFIYFVFSLEDIDQTLDLLWRVLLVVIAIAAVSALAMGLRIANRAIRPLRVAATAARRVAEGNLETRLDTEGEDELARLAEAFNRMTEALEERIARERRFVSDVSHELRTPLTALKTSIDFVADRADDLPARLRSAVGLASGEVKSLQRLVNDLLELTRAEAGGMEIAADDVDLVNFANEVIRRRAPDASVTIEGPPELIVCTDKSRLERVVGNLIENAVVHGGSGVVVSLEAADGLAYISVIDRGPGIDEHKLPRIFERFWRGDESRQRDDRVGAGLGLAIARENAYLIGAELRVASVPGEGTRFEVAIPTGASA